MEKQSFLLNILVYGITTIFLPLSFIIIQDHFLKQIDDFRMIYKICSLIPIPINVQVYVF